MSRKHRTDRGVFSPLVAGVGAATLTYLRAKFVGDYAEAACLVEAFGADVLLSGVTSVLRSSIAPDERLQFIDELTEGLIPTPPPIPAAFVRGK